MWWFSVLGTLLTATALKGLPLDANSDAEIVPALLENSTLATELKPPPIDESLDKRHGVVYLINLYAVTNSSDLEDGEEKLTDEVIESMPGILEPLATVLLVVEVDDEEDPVSLDDIAKDLQEEGFAVEKVAKDGETKVIKVDFGDAPEDEKKNSSAVPIVKKVDTSKNKVRRKRAPCLKCKLGNLLGGGGGGYGGGGYGGGGWNGGGGGGYPGGGCGGGCGGGNQGGGNSVGVIPVVVVPVTGYPSGGGGGYGGGGGGHHHHHHHHQGGGGGGYYPGGGGGGGQYPPGGGGGQCQVCGGQGGGGQGGSWSQSSAQASAQSSSGTW